MRSLARGLTTVDILIVIAASGILLLLTVPRFVDAMWGARTWTATTDAETLQKVIDLYKAQHGERDPYLNHRGEPDPDRFVARLTGRTDRTGRITARGDLGPYLEQWPANIACTAASRQTIVAFGTGPAPCDGRTGWYYNTRTGKIYANTPGAAGAEDGSTQAPRRSPHRKTAE